MKRLFNNSLFTSIDYFILIVLNLLATPILIAHFGIEGYGAFVFLSIFSIYGALSFFDLGMEGSLMNFVARFEVDGDKRKLQDTLSASLAYYSLLGLILGIALYIFGDFITIRLVDSGSALNYNHVKTSLSIISINVFLQFLTVPFAAILQGLRRFIITKSINSIMNIMRYLLIIIIAVYYHRIDYAFLIITILTVLRLIILLSIFVVRLPQFRRMRVRFNFSLLRTLFNYSSILFINRIIGLISNQIDKVLIWLYLVVTNMAIYDVVSRPANLLRLVLSILNSAVVPEVARLHHLNDLAAIRKMYINLIRYAYLIILPVLALLGVYINDFLRLWVGNEFVPHSHLAIILLAVYAILPIPSVSSTVVVGLEKVKQTIWIAIVATVINIILSLTLLQYLGLAGLLIATLVADLFCVLPYLFAMKRFLDFSIKQLATSLLPIAIISVLFLAAHTVQRLIFSDYAVILFLFAAVLFCGNCLVNYRYLLQDKEKLFLRERIKAAANKIGKGASTK
ncbi:MAG: oligosaccharide flippase family protein [candidate division Zixibacteria bacterium]|nr:oligosaccharide flippase family protein [candidate division Zixibacteria bacterium]